MSAVGLQRYGIRWNDAK